MRQLLLGAFVLFHRITGVKIPAYLFAIIYITALNLITINGLVFLMSEYIPSPIISITHLLFSLPLIFVTILIMLLINYFLFPQFKNLEKSAKNHDGYLSVLLYSVLALIIISYNQMDAISK